MPLLNIKPVSRAWSNQVPTYLKSRSYRLNFTTTRVSLKIGCLSTTHIPANPATSIHGTGRPIWTPWGFGRMSMSRRIISWRSIMYGSSCNNSVRMWRFWPSRSRLILLRLVHWWMLELWLSIRVNNSIGHMLLGLKHILWSRQTNPNSGGPTVLANPTYTTL